jgi:hypothetical protein
MKDLLENIWFWIIYIFLTLLHSPPKEQKSEIFALHTDFAHFPSFGVPHKESQKIKMIQNNIFSKRSIIILSFIKKIN